MNVPLFLVLFGSLTLAHIHLTLPTVPSSSTANPKRENKQFWNEGNVFHLKNNFNNQKNEERILQFTVAGFSSNSEAKLSSDSTIKSPKGQIWTTKFPNDDTLKMAQTRHIPEKGRGKDPLVEYSVAWKVARKLPRGVGCREVCFHYDATPTTPPTPGPTSSPPTQTHWYSTFLEKNQNWPLNKQIQKSGEFKAMPFTSSSANTDGAPIGSTVEYLFYSSAGFAIFLDDLRPWMIEVKADAFCISIPEALASPPEDHPREYLSLKWRILVASGLTQLWEASIGTVGYISRPSTPPSSAFLQRIIWPVSKILEHSTDKWESDIVSFTKHSNYPNALLYIDRNYGVNTPFTLPGKSGDQKALLQGLVQNGQQIAFYLSPKYLQTHMPNGTFSCLDPKEGSTKKGPLNWCYLDFSSENTGFWFTEGLEEFHQRTTIDIFFLQEAAVSDIRPRKAVPFTVQNPLLLKYPNFFTTLYSSLGLPFASGRSFAIDAAFKSQRLSNLVTFQVDAGHDSITSSSNIPQLIPKLLTLSLAGYQFIFSQVLFSSKHDQDDFRRWLSACLFLPALQLPASPWTLNAVDQTFENQMVKLLELRRTVHEQVQMETLISDWIHRGVPIIQPMWAADGSDAQLLTIDDQYMLGPDLVVAPYLQQNNRKTGIYHRTVYLPKGNWRDPNAKLIEGGKLIKVDSTLIDVPYFIRQEKAIE